MIKTFSEGELLARLPFMNITGSGLFDSVEKELPSVGSRAVNEGYKQSYGGVDPQSEAVHLFGGDVDVDRSIVDLQGPEARASQVEMKVRSMRLTLEAALINGDANASLAGGFDGLAKRLPPGAEMAINIGATALDFDKLDALSDAVNSYGGMNFLVMSKAMRRQLNAHGREVLGYGEAGGTSSGTVLTSVQTPAVPLDHWLWLEVASGGQRQWLTSSSERFDSAPLRREPSSLRGLLR